MDDAMGFDTTSVEENVWTLAAECDQQLARDWLERAELVVRGYALAAAAGRAEFVVCEIACSFLISELTAADLLAEARLLMSLPGLQQAVSDGRVRLPHARKVLSELAAVDDTLHELVLAEVLDRIDDQPPAQVGRIVRRAMLRADPAAAERRRQAAKRSRGLALYPARDGMADLVLNLDAEVGVRIYGLACAATERDDGSGRTADARRSDWIVEQILRGGGSDQGVDVRTGEVKGEDALADGRRRRSCQALVTISVSTALGLDDEPCELADYGPISAAHGRELLATAELRKVSLDASNGQVLHVDEQVVRPRPSAARRAAAAQPASDGRPNAPTSPADKNGSGGSDDGPTAGTSQATGEQVDPTRAGAAGPAGDQVSPSRKGAAGDPANTSKSTTNPATGAPLPAHVRAALLHLIDTPSVQPTEPEPQYRPSTSLARTVRTRSPRCDFPCCSVPASRCDLDHTRPWPRGSTEAGNLGPRSRRHHRAKQAGWTPSPLPDGSTLWHAPSGRTYRKPPDGPHG